MKKEINLQEICNATGINQDLILSRSRKREIVEQKCIIINLLRNKKKHTFTSIGKALNLDHSTIIYHVYTFDGIIKFNEPLRNKYHSACEALFQNK